MGEVKRFVPDEEIEHIYSFHPPPSPNIADAHALVRQMCKGLALALNAMLAESPQKTTLLRQELPAIMMRANQIIAVHGVDPEYFVADNTDDMVRQEDEGK